MAEFVFVAGHDAVSPVVRPNMAAMPGLAEAVIHINGLFILAKIHMKCSLVSVHHGVRHGAGRSSGVSKALALSYSARSESAADNEKVFDEFVGTFGLPFERRIDITTTANDEQPSPVLRHLQSLKDADICTYKPERTSHFVSINSLTQGLLTKRLSGWNADTNEH